MAKFCSECGSALKPNLLVYDYKTKYLLQEVCSKCNKVSSENQVEYISQELTSSTIRDALDEYIEVLSDELNISLLRERMSIKYEWKPIFNNASKDTNKYTFRDLEYKIDLPPGLADRVAHKLNEHFIKLAHLPKATSHTIMRYPFDHSIEMAIYSVEKIEPYIKVTLVAKTINAMKVIYFKKVEKEN